MINILYQFVICSCLTLSINLPILVKNIYCFMFCIKDCITKTFIIYINRQLQHLHLALLAGCIVGRIDSFPALVCYFICP